MNKKAEIKILYNIFKADVNRIMDWEIKYMTLESLLDSKTMETMTNTDLLEDVIDYWYKDTAEFYTLNTKERGDKIYEIDRIESSLLVDQE